MRFPGERQGLSADSSEEEHVDEVNDQQDCKQAPDGDPESRRQWISVMAVTVVERMGHGTLNPIELLFPSTRQLPILPAGRSEVFRIAAEHSTT